MSVPVNARKEGKLNVLVLALDLTTYTIMICKNPKVFNPLYNTAITNDIVHTSKDIYIKLWRANNIVVSGDKEKLRAKYYIRYMDDFVIISSDKGYLEHCKDAIAQQLYGIGLSYNEKKTSIYPLSDGIMFLGFRFRLTKDGKVLMILSPDNVKRERRKLSRLVNKYKHGETTKEKVYECYNGWKNHAEHGNSTLLIARMDAYLKEMLEVKDVSKAQ